jgi:hypothetical protein
MVGKEKSSRAFASARGSGLSVEESAKLAGISTRTAYRRLAEAQTAQEVAAVSEELDRLTFQRCLAMRERALDVLSAGLESPKEATRLTTARLILDHTNRLHERMVLLPEVLRLKELMSLSDITDRGSTNG